MRARGLSPAGDPCNNCYIIFHDEISLPLVLFPFYSSKIILSTPLYSENYNGKERTENFKTVEASFPPKESCPHSVHHTADPLTE